MSAAIWVPVIWVRDEAPDTQVMFCQTTSGPTRPALAYRSDVEDIGQLCMAVSAGLDANRGEWPDEAYVLATTPNHAQRKPLRGRSCALGMALASLSSFAHLPIHQSVVATGDLDGAGNVLPVQDLLTKLQACARQGHSRSLVLFPACQLPAGSAESRLSAADYRGLRAELPHLTPVRTLAEAANLALRPDSSFGSSPAAALRNEIEHLRYDRSRVSDLYDRSRALFELAAPLPDERGLGPILRYHALMTGEFALRTLVHDKTGSRSWPGVDAADNAELQARLLELAETIVERHKAWLPAELRAEHANFRAVRGFYSLDFLGAIHIADEALSLPKLVAGQHSERRKLLGTRAQFRWRQGLRMLAVDLRRDAETWLTLGLQDVREALELAPHGPAATESNDAARVRVYVCHALLALHCLRPWTQVERAEFDRHSHLVLGKVLGGEQHGGQPSQHPGWMLDAVLQRLRLEGDLHGALALWEQTAAIEYRVPGTESAGPLKMARILQPNHQLQPCDVNVLQTLLVAAIELGEAERACTFAQRLMVHHTDLSLPALVRLWPATWAPAEWALPLPQWLTAWQQNPALDFRLPTGVEQETFITAQLQALARPSDSHLAQRRLQLWLGVAA